jgi:hypothetical protein
MALSGLGMLILVLAASQYRARLSELKEPE